MANGFLTVDGKYRKGESAFLTVNGVYREIEKGFRTVNGVYERIMSSIVTWNKYACTRNSTNERTYRTRTNSRTTRTIYFGSEAQIESKYTLYRSYSWTSSSGYVPKEPKGFYIENAGDAMGYYITTTSGEYEYLWEVTSATNGSENVTLTRIGTASYTTETVYSYSRGNLIGTVEAPEGEYPDNLTYVTDYSTGTILSDGSTYYWYERQDDK